MPAFPVIKLRQLTALALALGLFGCDQAASIAPAPANTVRIVSSLPGKGYARAQAEEIEQAIRLAIDERQGKIGELSVEYVSLDNSDEETGEWSRNKELANARRAAADPSVIAYIGPLTSGAAMVSVPVTNRAGLLHVSPSATWPGLTRDGYNPGEPGIYYPTGARNFIGMMPDDSLQARAAAEWASSLGIENLTVLTDGSTYSSGLAGSFEQNTSASVDAKRTIDPLDLEDLASQVEDSDAVFYAPSSVQNALAVAEALRGVDVRVFSTDVALDPQFLNGAGVEAARWHIVSNSVSDPALFDAFTNFGERFKQSYVARYGETPGQYAMNAYDMSTRILSHVEKLATADQDRSRDRSQILRDVWNERAEGAMGFRADGRPAGARMSGYTWRDGRFQVSNIFQVSP